MDVNDLLNLIKEGEGPRVEFKRDFSPDIGEEIVALSNADGGYIIIGVDDNGNIVGCDLKKILDRLPGVIANIKPHPNIKVERISIGGKEIVVIVVQRSKEILSIGDISYIRIGAGKRRLSFQEILQRKVENLLLSFDSLKSPAKVDEINEEYFMDYLRKRKEIRGTPFFGDTIEDLRSTGLLVEEDGEYYLRYAAVLFFLENPQKYLYHAKIRYAEFDENLEITYQKEFSGPVWEQIEEAYNFINSRIGNFVIRVGAGRREFREYPMDAVREAIINAVAHRNYSLFSDIRIMKFKDRLVVRSPGSFPPDLDLSMPEHIPRNPLLSKLLYDIGLIERYGIGIRRMKESCRKHPVVEVEFKSRPYVVDVIFKKSYKAIDEIDRAIISLRKEGFSIGEIARRLGKSKSTVYTRMKKLRSMGLL